MKGPVDRSHRENMEIFLANNIIVPMTGSGTTGMADPIFPKYSIIEIERVFI